MMQKSKITLFMFVLSFRAHKVNLDRVDTNLHQNVLKLGLFSSFLSMLGRATENQLHVNETIFFVQR